jgi:DNA-binding transcriptional LysR family regulator
MHLDLDALRALDAVVRCDGYARAALHLHKVQSAVSYQVRKLERQLGLQLLDREGYRVRLTAAGEAVLFEGRQLLAQAEHLESVARQFSIGWEPRLTVIVDGILPLEPTLSALKTLATERVPTRIQVKVEFLGGVQYRFEKDDADLMLVKDYEARPRLKAETLPPIECVLCVASSHPLAGAKSVSLAELHQHVELSVQDSSEQGDDRHMFGGERVFYLSGFVAKKQALQMGLGFGWMPTYLVSPELKSGVLRELRFVGGSRYRFTPLLVHRIDRPLGRTGKRLTSLIRNRPRAGRSQRSDTVTGQQRSPLVPRRTAGR